jgi:hypothetical protein
VNVKLELQACDSLDGFTWTKIAERSGGDDWVLTGATMPAPESAAVNGAISLSVQESVPLPLGTRRFYRLVASLNP